MRIVEGTEIPVDAPARVVTSTALGDNRLDVRPAGDAGPYLQDGDTLLVRPEDQPAALESLISDIETSLLALDPESLATVGDSTATALEGNGERLGAIIEDTAELTAVLADTAPTLRGLVDDGLVTVRALARRQAPLSGAATVARDVTGQLARREDTLVVTPVFRDRGPAWEAGLTQGARGLNALAGTVRDGRADFQLVATQGPVCVYPYEPRDIGDRTWREPDLRLYCPPGEDLEQRGSRAAPRPNDEGLANATEPGTRIGPDMAKDPAIIPTGKEIAAYWASMMEGLHSNGG